MAALDPHRRSGRSARTNDRGTRIRRDRGAGLDGIRAVVATVFPETEIRLSMRARQHMLDGIARMNAGDWPGALGEFEAAIDLREATAWRDDPNSAWLLAAAWINRSDVLRHFGLTADGIVSLDRAIEAMQFVAVSENPGYAQRSLLAWINRGTACGEAGRFEEALAGFTTAEKMLPTISNTELLGSMLHANRARVLLEMGRTVEAWRDSRAAVHFLAGLAPAPIVLEAGIRARGIRCRALALVLDEPAGAEKEEDWIAAATDSAEEALALVRSTGYRGAWVADLVRYGAKIYRICQPHFLGEFLSEWLGPDSPLAHDAGLRQEMRGELLLAQADLEREVRRAPHDTAKVGRAIAILKSLQRAE